VKLGSVRVGFNNRSIIMDGQSKPWEIWVTNEQRQAPRVELDLKKHEPILFTWTWRFNARFGGMARALVEFEWYVRRNYRVQIRFNGHEFMDDDGYFALVRANAERELERKRDEEADWAFADDEHSGVLELPEGSGG
jgi:hypothetical protein